MIAEIKSSIAGLTTQSCVAGGIVHFTFHPLSGRVCDGHGREICRMHNQSSCRHYKFSDGTAISIGGSQRDLLFDDMVVEEQWPLPTKPIFVSGVRTFVIRPEDDAVLFGFAGSIPPT